LPKHELAEFERAAAEGGRRSRDVAAWRRLGVILEFQGGRAEARTAFEGALKLDPRNEEAKKALK
jgi:Flp pilus assembly protein TadD